ncbi:hypothetical protein ASG23_02575 [Cellulomonas sp. Leaf395]|nr:hypothetical protein ASG23_02575 [Cellulomonas sp. Leaf395]
MVEASTGTTKEWHMALPMRVLWPVAKKLAGQISVLVATNPDVQRRLTDAGKKIVEVQKARTPEAKIAKAMDAVREQARAVLDAEGSESVVSVQAASWKQRADQVERALQILQHQPRKARKTQLDRIAAMSDSLLAEVFTSLIDDVAAESSGDLELGDTSDQRRELT